MGSILTTAGKITEQKGVLGTTINTPIYLQFVHGECVEPITSTETLKAYNDAKNINSILAIPHIRNGVKKKRSDLTDTDRYYPLFRGIVDVPAKGDPVLLCDIGDVKYYLGPLNTENDVNFNIDKFREPEINLTSDITDRESRTRLARGESLNFKRKDVHRMSKKWNSVLDNNKSFNETHGDMMFEGRHGNSIRIGSRKDNPYIFLSNGRQSTFQYESLADGSLICITQKGSISQHLGGHFFQPEPDNTSNLEYVNGFILSSDYTPANETPPNRLMSSLVSSVNGNTNVNDIIYNFGKVEENAGDAPSPNNENQMLFYSDRIIINSKTNDIYLSARNDIHIGAKRHLTISTGDDLIIESEKINFGDPNKKTMDNMVLGKRLQTALRSIVDIFEKFTIVTQLGEQPISKSPSYNAVTKPAIDKALGEIKSIISSKHFIEEN